MKLYSSEEPYKTLNLSSQGLTEMTKPPGPEPKPSQTPLILPHVNLSDFFVGFKVTYQVAGGVELLG